VTIHPTDLNQPEPESWLATQHDAACSICGGPPTAVWVGRSTIWTCHRCALETLPQLIADAVHVRSDADRPMTPFLDAVPEFLGRFWYGVASRLARPLRADREREPRKPGRPPRSPEPRRPARSDHPSEN
jgi:hypothetical protein